MRPDALLKLLQSVAIQTLYPNEILIIDGSTDTRTEKVLLENPFNNLKYFKVAEHQRGLTKQRNYGIEQVDAKSEVVCFLDDDVILESSYFKHLIDTYYQYSNALAVGGYITNEVKWELTDTRKRSSKYFYDGWMRDEPLRFRVRRFFCLAPDVPPGYLPSFSHARPISFLPPSNKVYQVEFFMGGVASYKKEIFKQISFSNYFKGYGLYEDLDFCLRASEFGELFVNTAARLQHFHAVDGRPNKYAFGKMVVRNSWYIWKRKYSKPRLESVLKFHFTVIILIGIHFIHSFFCKYKLKSLTETFGRLSGWLSLFFNKPKIQ